MTRRTRSMGLAALVIAVATLAGPTTAPADAQSSGRLDLAAQTLFVDDDPAEFVLRVSGAPADATIEFTILRTPVRNREDLRASFTGTSSGGARVAFFECSLDGDCGDEASLETGSGGLLTVTLLDDLIGLALRSNHGALPVRVRLLDAERTELDSFRTSLIVPSDATNRAVRVAFVSRVGAPVSLRADQRAALDIDDLRATAATLEAHPDLPVTVEVTPETLAALDQAGNATLDRILEIIDDRPLMRVPWVEMDEEAWRAAGESAQVVQQYALGNDTLEAHLGRSPTGLVRLDPDAQPATIGLLRTVGAGAVIVTDEQLVDPPPGSDALQPFQLVDDNGVAIPALRIDAGLAETFDDSDPELAGYQALAELAIAAADPDDDRDLGVVIDLDALDPVALDVLLDGIDNRDELVVAPATALLELEPAVTIDGSLRRGELLSEPAPDVTALAAEIRAAGEAIDTLAAMLAPELGPITPLRDQLRAAVSSSLTADEASSYTTAVVDDVLAGTVGIEIAPGERITLTDRRTDLPLTVTNTQQLPVNVVLLLDAEKLRFPNGDRLEVTLRPGVNHVVIEVETLASGDARVTATLVSPGGRFELATGTVDIRSTAISGLGLVISIIALLVLGAWWIRTIRRIRRNRATATVSAAPLDAVEDTGPASMEG